MSRQNLENSTPENPVTFGEQRAKINENFIDLYEVKLDAETGKSLISDAEIERLASVINQTKQGLGLENVDNTADADKPINDNMATALGLKVDKETGKRLTSDTEFESKQNKLVDGTNIKTINGASILGNGDITIAGDGGTFKGSIAPTDTTPTQDGTYVPTISGTYTNAGGQVVNLNDGYTTLILTGSVWSKQVVPVGSFQASPQNTKDATISSREIARPILTFTSGYIANNGVVTASGSFKYSQLIPIDVSIKEIQIAVGVFSGVRALAFYDVSEAFIETKGVTGNDITVTNTNPSAKFVRYSCATNDVNPYVTLKGNGRLYNIPWLDLVPPTWEAKAYKENDNVTFEGIVYTAFRDVTALEKPIESSKWAKKIYGEEKLTSLIGAGKIDSVSGLVTPTFTNANSTWTDGFYINTTGVSQSAAGFSHTERKTIIAGSFYNFLSEGYAVSWYTDADVFISYNGKGTDKYGTLRTFRSPSNAKYARFNIKTHLKENFNVRVGLSESPIARIYRNKNTYFNNTRLRAEIITDFVEDFDFTANQLTGNIVISGDSTIAAFVGQTAIADIIKASGTITSIAVPGDTVNGQHGRWNALDASIRNNANFVCIQIGLNDLTAVGVVKAKINSLQTYINKVRTDAPNAKILIGGMIPARGSFGGNAFYYQNWIDFNAFISNKLLLNVDYFCTSHIGILSDDDENLRDIFNTGDDIHENTLARKVIAYCWLSYLKK